MSAQPAEGETAAAGVPVATVDDESPLVLWELDDGVLTLSLNRPERNNAWNPDMERQYYDALRRADADPAVRVIILTGQGRSFCPGVDTGRLDSLVGRPLNLTGRLSSTTPLAVRKPMIAAINGACAGMGLVQALMCDIRVMARGVRLTTAFARRGLAAEYGISYLLPRIVGVESALDLLLSGRVIDAEEAKDLGLVSRIAESGEALVVAKNYARMLAEFSSPISMALIRHQVLTGLDQDLERSMRSTYRSMASAVVGPDFREGLTSFMEDRRPQFVGLADDFSPSAITGDSIAAAFQQLDLSAEGEALNADK